MRWIISENSVIPDCLDGMSDITSKILVNRLSSEGFENINDFFYPKLSRLSNPEEIKGMVEAVDRIESAINNREKIRIHGDYDADGITSTYILYRTLKDYLKCDVDFHLPNRINEGYGISDKFVDVCLRDPCLVITVDCGITECEKIEKLKNGGVDVVITDHHEVGESGIPNACAVVDPKRADETCNFRSFAGVGVAFKLCWALCKRMSTRLDDTLSNCLKSLIPYVAIGTIADVMPLIGENRILCSIGINMIKNGQAGDGINNLVDVSGLALSTITSKDIGFMIAPRINSAGRIDDPKLAIDCFISGNRSAAAKLNQLNDKRKEISQDLFDKAISIVKSDKQIGDSPIIVIGGEEWHEGVIGIVAGKLAESIGRPAIVISYKDGIGRGSGRSVQDFNLREAVSSASQFLNGFGGHAQALGLSIEADKIDDFRSSLSKLFEKNKISKSDCLESVNTLNNEGPLLLIDSKVEISDITTKLMQEIDKLEPFGEGNNEPLFLLEDYSIIDYKTIGKDKNHLSLTAIKDGHSMRGIAFFADEMINIMNRDPNKLDIVFTPVWNSFNGKTNLEMRIKDIKISEKI